MSENYALFNHIAIPTATIGWTSRNLIFLFLFIIDDDLTIYLYFISEDRLIISSSDVLLDIFISSDLKKNLKIYLMRILKELILSNYLIL